ncbi:MULTISPECIES: amidase [unclassified Rhizobium]|uniref:amidase n=1 Tax=unclassified Rhizobium TaxID=2613769 RepID=UPI00161D9F57|nr:MULTISPECIES: amidase [unclassified Rhizobium]MBB3542397.1 aspartyl-tRNA(Asn)/glutamyl-tRNA(Gln) amidotransferase subunit A [Rhizobium sp. BK399]MCS3738262.1 aspartyl-tRNA(Asn)/glutamyl-tRNA(Gln) amidotransferase subunit A [Rhizobium sp. BK661]MCS4093102.1 aspartyl-tRNA(Asn)/glutamyl-tRNA(Gln) amidotransferase subunit A [Rhizobium sp. BK176]
MSETDLTIRELRQRFADRSLSPLEYWLALERHIEAWEPAICALYAYDPEAARQQAKASTDRWTKGATLGVLDGIPATLKELIATKGQPVPLGTRAMDLVPAAEDAPAAARLLEDGAVLFAKTTCPDYGMLSSGLSSFHRLSRNPWDTSQNPGGSSAGASAAAAAGYGPLHVGTDIGGSVRLPAGWTGIFGFKPSHGRIPIDPFYVGRCAGPMTRTVEDAAYAMATLSRPDWRDGTSLPPNDFDWMDLDIDVRGLRIGLMLDAGCGLAVDDEVRAGVEAAAQRFEDAGAIVIPVQPVLTREMLDGLDAFWRSRFWADIETLSSERRSRILPYVYAWAEGGASISGAGAVRGFNQTIEMRKSCGRLFTKVDAVISPTNPIVSYPADWASPTNDPARPFEHICFTVPWNMSEQPASSINCGFSRSGMPIGLQIVGPRFDDMRVLRLSKAFETWTGGVGSWPQPPVR